MLQRANLPRRQWRSKHGHRRPREPCPRFRAPQGARSRGGPPQPPRGEIPGPRTGRRADCRPLARCPDESVSFLSSPVSLSRELACIHGAAPRSHRRGRLRVGSGPRSRMLSIAIFACSGAVEWASRYLRPGWARQPARSRPPRKVALRPALLLLVRQPDQRPSLGSREPTAPSTSCFREWVSAFIWALGLSCLSGGAFGFHRMAAHVGDSVRAEHGEGPCAEGGERAQGDEGAVQGAFESKIIGAREDALEEGHDEGGDFDSQGEGERQRRTARPVTATVGSVSLDPLDSALAQARARAPQQPRVAAQAPAWPPRPSIQVVAAPPQDHFQRSKEAAANAFAGVNTSTVNTRPQKCVTEGDITRCNDAN